jgi:hypothetical protein
VKGLTTLAAGLLLVVGAFTNTVAVAAQFLPSAPKITVVVTRAGKPLEGARVTFHRAIPYGETDPWTGLTGIDGTVSPPELADGKYRIFAHGGKHTAGLFVEVKRDNEGSSKFEIAIADDNEPYVLQWVPESSWLRQFRGFVQDEQGG